MCCWSLKKSFPPVITVLLRGRNLLWLLRREGSEIANRNEDPLEDLLGSLRTMLDGDKKESANNSLVLKQLTLQVDI